MNENNSQLNRKWARDKLGLTKANRLLVDKRRSEIFAQTGILQPRYAIINEAIIKAYGSGGEV